MQYAANILGRFYTSSWNPYCCHGDDKGLRLPPRLAPYQVVLIPFKGDDSAALLDKLQSIKTGLEARGVRVFWIRVTKLRAGNSMNGKSKEVPVRLELALVTLRKAKWCLHAVIQ